MSSNIANNNQQFSKTEVIQVPAGITSDQNDFARGVRGEAAQRDRVRQTVDDARIAAGTALELALEALARLSEIEAMLDL